MADASGYFRHPSIHGDTIVFVCEDDLWTVSAEGGVPRRLTASPAACSFPVFSPDGTRIAFTARDEGPAEAYVIDAQGGDPRRLTWLGALTTTSGWSRDGSEVLVASDAGQPFRGYAHLHAAPAAGGPARRRAPARPAARPLPSDRLRAQGQGRRDRAQRRRPRPLEALPRRHRRHPLDRPQGRRRLRPLRPPRRQPGRADVDRRPRLLPL